MAFKPLEDLSVWQAARDLAVRVFDLTARSGFGPHPGLRDQLERAAVSISNHLAEGYERGTTADLLTSLTLSQGSAGQVRSMLAILGSGDEWAGLRAEVDALLRLTSSVSRQLGAWIESLKEAEPQGPWQHQPTARPHREPMARPDAFPSPFDPMPTVARTGWEPRASEPVLRPFP